MPFAATWMDPEIIILREVRGELAYDIPYIQKPKRNDTNELTYKTKIDSQTQRTNLQLQGRMGRGRDSWGVWKGHVQTAILKVNNQQRPPVQHRNSVQQSVISCMGNESKK